MSIPPMYSTVSRSHHGPVPVNTQESVVHVEGHFPIRDLLQTDVLDVVRKEPLAPPSLRTGYEVLLSNTLEKIYGSVGLISLDGEQLGSCTLISWNLGIIPCHCIQELDVRSLEGKFGFWSDNDRHMTLGGTLYHVEGVVDYNLELDYAIVKFSGTPGEKYGFLSFNHEEEAHDEPALLHHPLGKPLKVSVRSIIHSKYHSNMLETFHDSDYGSSGGAYISPSGSLVALHLGAERQQKDYNLVRLALPIRKIIETHPRGIIATFAYQKWNQKDRNDQIDIINIFLPFVLREFIDLEKYDKKMMVDYGYIVRMPDGDKVPGVIIDSHQKKHLPGWPSQIEGKRGSIFPAVINNDDLVSIVEAIVKYVPLFGTYPTPFTGTKVERWYFEKNHLEKSIFKNLTIPPKINGRSVPAVIGVEIEYGWAEERTSWEMHIVPLTK